MLRTEMPSFLLISCILYVLLEICDLVHGAENSSILWLEQNDTKLFPS